MQHADTIPVLIRCATIAYRFLAQYTQAFRGPVWLLISGKISEVKKKDFLEYFFIDNALPLNIKRCFLRGHTALSYCFSSFFFLSFCKD